MSFSTYSDRNTIGAILSRKYRSMLLFTFMLLVGLWGTLSAYVLNNLYREAMDRMYSWVLVNKPRLEEALFLNNLESVGFRVSNFESLSDHLTYSEMTLYDANEKLVFGKTDFPGQIRLGLGYSLVGLNIQYFDSLTFTGRKVGYLYIRSWLKPQILVGAGALILILCLVLFLGVQRLLRSFMATLQTRIVLPISKLRESMNRFDMEGAQELAQLPGPKAPTELVELYDGYNSLLQRIREYSELEVKRAEADATVRIAAQVAHDIRSPLAALKTASSSLNAIPEESRNLIRLAVDRIHDIANNLIQKNTQLAPAASNAGRSGEMANELLLILVDELISEKRAEFASRPKLKLEFTPAEQAYSFFAHVHAGELKRVLSNLINNAAEAIAPDADGLIHLQLNAKFNRIEVRIQDNGKGIPESILPKLTERGFSYDKADGTGLGLYHAKQTLENWGGTLQIHSKEKKTTAGEASEAASGTTVTLSLPKADPPHWFLPSLRLVDGQQIVVADDDASVHQLWQGRLKQAAAESAASLNIVDLYTPEELRQWVKENSTPSALLLVDYEFSGTAENGLELIESLALAKQSVLVTGRYSDGRVRTECNRLDLRLLPKPLVGKIPIIFPPGGSTLK